LAQWEKDGIVQLFYAYSKASDLSKGCRHVQDRLWAEKESMVEVFNKGAKLYVCGSSMVGEGVASMTKRIYQDSVEANGGSKSDEEVEGWFQSIKGERYASDVFV
jgi:cytochrome P450/NADPH-cytochrome P450 reductase